MAYDKKELQRLLIDSGFYLKRQTKHAQWSDGITRITMPSGRGFSSRLFKMISLQIQKAVELREKRNAENTANAKPICAR